MEVNLFNVDDVAPETVIGLFGDADEVCDCQGEYREHYHYWSTFAGGHRLNEEVIKSVIIPVINWMKNPDYTSHRIYSPFEAVSPGDTGFIGDINGMDNHVNTFKIYKKGIGRKWYEEIVEEHQGKKHYDGSIDLHFPTLPEGVNEESVQLVYGNRWCQAPSVEIYGKDGVQVTDGDFIINDNIHIHEG